MGARAWLLGAVLAVVGCGEEAEPEPFAALRIQPSAAIADARVAVVWADYGDDARQAQVTDHQRLESGELLLRRLPDDDGFVVVDDADGAIAVGGLVAYRDRNDNDRFDLTPIIEPAFRDEVIGWAAGLRLVVAPEATVASRYERGVNLELHYVAEDLGTTSAVLPPDFAITIHLFDVPEAACFGLSPIPAAMPRVIGDALAELDPVPAARWPYSIGVPPCPDNDLPADWYRIQCREQPGRYLVQILEWPWDDDIAELCGWTTRYCTIERAAGAPLPPEYPLCE